MPNTVKKKAVTVVRLTTKPGKQGQKPMTKDIMPGELFDCPKDLVAELTKSGSITAPDKATSQEAAETAPPADDDKDPEKDAADATAELVKEAKELGVKGVNKNWSDEKLTEAIAAKKAELGIDDDDAGDDGDAGDGDDEDVM